jgi:hypothetical protein
MHQKRLREGRGRRRLEPGGGGGGIIASCRSQRTLRQPEAQAGREAGSGPRKRQEGRNWGLGGVTKVASSAQEE